MECCGAVGCRVPSGVDALTNTALGVRWQVIISLLSSTLGCSVSEMCACFAYISVFALSFQSFSVFIRA